MEGTTTRRSTMGEGEEEDGGEWDEEDDEERVYEGKRRAGERTLPIQKCEAEDMGEVGGRDSGACPWHALMAGTFNTSIETALAYDDVARRLYGDDAKLNLPDFHAQPTGGRTFPAQAMATTSTTDHHHHMATSAWEVDKTQNEEVSGMNGSGGGGDGGNVEMFWEEMMRLRPAVEDGERWGYYMDSFDMFGSKF